MTLYVDQQTLATEARRLAELATSVDATAGSIPSGIDGGVGTAAILGIFTVFTDSGGQLATALTGTSTALTDCVSNYAAQDDASAESLGAAAWAE